MRDDDADQGSSGEPESELHGNKAVRFAAQRLKELKSENWQTEYVDESTGDRWVVDHPNSGHPGGGSPRLRRVLSPP